MGWRTPIQPNPRVGPHHIKNAPAIPSPRRSLATALLTWAIAAIQLHCSGRDAGHNMRREKPKPLETGATCVRRLHCFTPLIALAWPPATKGRKSIKHLSDSRFGNLLLPYQAGPTLCDNTKIDANSTSVDVSFRQSRKGALPRRAQYSLPCRPLDILFPIRDTPEVDIHYGFFSASVASNCVADTSAPTTDRRA